MISNDLLKERFENNLRAKHKELYDLVEKKIEENDYTIGCLYGDTYVCVLLIETDDNLLPFLFNLVGTADNILKRDIDKYETELSVAFGTKVSLWSNEVLWLEQLGVQKYVLKLGVLGV